MCIDAVATPRCGLKRWARIGTARSSHFNTTAAIITGRTCALVCITDLVLIVTANQWPSRAEILSAESNFSSMSGDAQRCSSVAWEINH